MQMSQVRGEGQVEREAKPEIWNMMEILRKRAFIVSEHSEGSNNSWQF